MGRNSERGQILIEGLLILSFFVIFFTLVFQTAEVVRKDEFENRSKFSRKAK